jgi:predicted  nucleic acid-binding Zn-ribbon protein
MKDLCDGCGWQFEGPTTAYLVRHINRESLLVCDECAQILLTERKGIAA